MATLQSMRMGYSVVFFLFLASIFPIQVSSQETEGPQTTYICEGKSWTIQCTEPGIINIISASYGARDYTDHCAGGCLLGCDCFSDVATRVQELCNGKSTCEVWSHNDVFGDPCLGRHKLLTLTYDCSYAVATTVMTTTNKRTAQPSTSIKATVVTVTFTTDGHPKTTEYIIRPQSTIGTRPQTVLTTTDQGFTVEDISTSGTTVEVPTTLRGNSDALHGDGPSQGNIVIIAATSAGVAAVILIAGVAGFILWKRRKTTDSADSPTSMHNNTYDDVTTSSNIQLTNTGAAYRTDGNCNPTEPANIADLYAKPNKKKPAPNVDQLYAKPMKKKSNVSNVDELYAKPHKTTGASNNHCDNELDSEEDGSVDNMLYETTGNITFTTTGNEEGYVDNELYGSTA
ncbi:uncharacterized protein LOC144887831 [Branchiostoma floridae x Branchiostoma japonicum]